MSKRVWHELFGHGKNHIEEHNFRVGTHSKGVLYTCHGCGAGWFKWEIRFLHDLLKPMEAEADLRRYCGSDV